MSRPAAEVVVVGGGPAGAATAAWLARAGRDVLLLEKAAFPREKPCAEYLSPGVVAALDRLGALPAVRAADAAWPWEMRLRTAQREAVLRYPDASVAGGWREALGITRGVFDAVLLDHARHCGAQVRERTRVLGPLVEQGRVVGVRVAGERGVEPIAAGVVVAADGIHSTLTRALGLQRPVGRPRRLGLVARYRGVAGLDQRGEMHVGATSYCGLAPVGAGLVSVGLVVGLDDRRAGETATARFERGIAALPGVARRLTAAERVTPVRGIGPIARRVRRVAGPGYLLVGDAAGFLDPFTGEGVFRALRGAELAASAIAVAGPGGAGDCLAATYAQARRRAFADRERATALIQIVLGSRRLLDYALARLASRPEPAARFAAVVGDYAPARPLLTPAFLWALLRP
jgi:geranylgeranyl reductase family protein